MQHRSLPAFHPFAPPTFLSPLPAQVSAGKPRQLVPRRHRTWRPHLMNSSTPRPLAGKNALVTGASRGIGRGVAVALGAAGARVFITGRVDKHLAETARLVCEAAGAPPPLTAASDHVCRAVVCDHGNDEDVRRCFADVADDLRARGGRLDVVVSNAFSGAQSVLSEIDGPYWAKGDPSDAPGKYWDAVNNVGLRSNYTTIVHATRLMLPHRTGLIVNISSFGGSISLFDAAYGCGKCANDRMVAEFGRELRGTGVCAVTLYPGLVSTEFMLDGPLSTTFTDSHESDSFASIRWNAESPVYVGRVIAAMTADSNPHVANRRQGQIVVAAEAGNLYGVTDVGGERRYSGRSIRTILFNAAPSLRLSAFNRLVPDLLIPWWLVTMTKGAAPAATR